MGREFVPGQDDEYPEDLLIKRIPDDEALVLGEVNDDPDEEIDDSDDRADR